MSCSLWGAVAAGKQNAHGGVLSDEEEEGMVCDEGDWTNWKTAHHHDGSSGSCSLGSLLVDLHKRFVYDFRQHQVVAWRHA